MRRAVEHRGKAKELALRGLIDYDFLVVLIDSRHAYFAGYEYVAAAAFISDFVDSLAGDKLFHLNLAGENGGFVVVQQGEKGNVSQQLSITMHPSPRTSTCSRLEVKAPARHRGC